MTARAFIVSVALFACASAASAQTFDPLAFFTGKTRGDGSLKILLRAPVPIHIESRGTPDGKGGMTLDQTIHEGSKPPRDRQWVLRPTSPTTMTGTITDTPGKVRGRLHGKDLILNYGMKGGMKAHQVLTIQPGGRTVVNRMIVRRFGIVVARVEETIRKLD